MVRPLRLLAMDRGWVMDPADDDRWVLLDQHGEPVAQTWETIRQLIGQELHDETMTGHGWPPLPAVPDLVCMLEQGPQDGRWVFLPFGPPESLSFARSQPPRVAAAGVRVTGLVGGYDRYVLARRPCGNGHGRLCPYRYRWEPF